jgi:hypothetical protein
MVSADFEIAGSQKPMRYDFQRKQSGLNHACLVHSPPNPHTQTQIPGIVFSCRFPSTLGNIYLREAASCGVGRQRRAFVTVNWWPLTFFPDLSMHATAYIYLSHPRAIFFDLHRREKSWDFPSLVVKVETQEIEGDQLGGMFQTWKLKPLSLFVQVATGEHARARFAWLNRSIRVRGQECRAHWRDELRLNGGKKGFLSKGRTRWCPANHAIRRVLTTTILTGFRKRQSCIHCNGLLHPALHTFLELQVAWRTCAGPAFLGMAPWLACPTQLAAHSEYC